MPRIEPYQLLKCLSVLLGPSGGIRSSDVVHRIVSLMTKFSKKLVSKCIYILILKSTEVDLLDMFMSAGGWDLTFSWLSDGIQAKNWPLVVELVELLLICPVDIERLKGNTCPKVIKLLSKDITATENVRDLAGKVVEQWLAIVKGACEASSVVSGHPQTTQEQDPLGRDEEEVVVENGDIVENGVEELMEDAGAQLPVYKITIRDGKQVLAEVISSDRTAQPRVDSVKTADATTPTSQSNNSSAAEAPAANRASLRLGGNNAQSDSQDGRTSSEVLSSESDSEDEVRPVQIGRKRPSPGSKKEPVAKKRAPKRSSPSSSDPDFVVGGSAKSAKPKKAVSSEKKMKLEPRKEKKEEKSKSKEPAATAAKSKLKDDQSEKDKNTLAKLIGPPLTNLGKIPKKAKEEDDKRPDRKPPAEPSKPPPKDPKKYNISVETRKSSGERPKTVKMFNSKFRKTGLEEVPPPPPVPKSVKKPDKEEEKKPLKRSSPPPPKELSPVVEKKLKEEEKKLEKPLTPPKSKIMILQESDVFADALTAANPVRDVKKKKRRTSLSEGKKESSHDKKSDEKKSQDPVKPSFKFYQDTLVTSEDKNGDESSMESKGDAKPKTETKHEAEESDDLGDLEINEKVCPSSPVSKEELEDEVAKAEEAINQVLMMEDKKNMEREKNRLPKGILVYVKKRKAVKRGVQWKPDKDLEATRYFELDETERVNVTKPFMDMKQMERINEREHVLLSRKLAADDIMEEKTAWKSLIPVDIPADQVVPIAGKNSLEKEIQYARERTTLQAIYFNRRMIPESANEPDLEIHAYTEPAVIPLEDQTGNAESVMNYKNKPWPEPKGYAPGSPEAAQGLLGTGPPEAAPYHQGPLLPNPHPHHHHQQPPPPPHHQPPPPPHYPGGPYPPPPQGPMGGPPGPGDWMGDGNMMPGNMMMGGGGGDMMGPMMGGPDQQQPPPPQQQQHMYPMGPHHGGEFMGGPHPPFMGPPHPPFMGPPPGPFAPNQPPQGPPPHDMHRPPRPWFRQNTGTWRHPSKGGGSWNHKSRGMCNNVLKKGFCRVNKCPFRHPPGSSSGGGPPPSPR